MLFLLNLASSLTKLSLEIVLIWMLFRRRYILLNLADVIAELSLELVLFDMIFWKGKQVSLNLFLLHSELPLKLGLRSFSSLFTIFRCGTEGNKIKKSQ